MPCPLFICMPIWTTRPEPVEGVSHAPGVAGVEGHGFFLVHVLACLDGGDEVKRVQVLRRRDQDRVDRLVVEERPVVLERRDAGDDRLHFIEAPGVDVGDRGRLDVGTLDRGPQDLLAARTAADQTEPDSLVRRPGPGPPRRCRGPAIATPVAPPIIDPKNARRLDMACLLDA